MITKLVEFKNSNQFLLRGILTLGYNNSQDIVIMVGGFERACTTEKKFKALADKLADNNITAFRFDATDCGLSDGDFYNTTTKSLAEDLLCAIDYLKKSGYQRFSIVGHSFACCAISLILNKINFEKIVLIAPALNQKELLRLWFAQKNNKDLKIGWNNYKNYYIEEEFLKESKSEMLTKSHRLNYKYRFNNKDIDYSSKYIEFPNKLIMLIHGTNDDKVPLESLNIKFGNKVIIDNGDHELEQPPVIEQWISKCIDFLKEKYDK